MAHFARIDENNIVQQVIVVNNSDILKDGIEDEKTGIAFCQNLLGGNWVQTSYNNNFRKIYAGKGYKYDVVNDIFIYPQPYPSWTLDENNVWQPPIPKPKGELEWTWDEVNQEWV
jgi:hypothetical protein